MLSRWFGNILMGYVANTIIYAIYLFAPELELLTYINTFFDFILMSMLGCCAVGCPLPLHTYRNDGLL